MFLVVNWFINIKLNYLIIIKKRFKFNIKVVSNYSYFFYSIRNSKIKFFILLRGKIIIRNVIIIKIY